MTAILISRRAPRTIWCFSSTLFRCVSLQWWLRWCATRSNSWRRKSKKKTFEWLRQVGTSRRSRVDLFMMAMAFLQYYTFHHFIYKSCWFSPTWCMYPKISEHTWSIWQLQIWFTWPCRAPLCYLQDHSKHVQISKDCQGQIGGSIDIRLVVWNMIFISPYIGNFIIPTDEVIFFRRVAQPPTRYWSMAWCRSRLGDGEDQTLRGEPREAADQSTTGTRWPIFDVECGVFHRDVGCFWTLNR